MSNIEDIIQDEQQSEEFITKFKNFAMSIGEPLYEPLGKERVLGVFKANGYWAGDAYRIHYDEMQGFVAQPRLFGAR